MIGSPWREHLSSAISEAQLFADAAASVAVSLDKLAAGGPILVLAPHPDDDVLGCGGLIAACAAAGIAVHIVYLTDGRHSHLGSRQCSAAGLTALRHDEARAGAHELGLGDQSLTFLGNADQSLLFSRAARQKAAGIINQIIGDHKIKRIFGPWIHDPHPDHVAAALLARRMGVMTGLTVFSYPVYGRFLPPRTSFRDRAWTALRLDISNYIDVKRRALACHRTQTTGLIADAVVRLVAPPSEAFLTGEEIFFM